MILEIDFEDVKGQENIKRHWKIAAVVPQMPYDRPPGAGKTHAGKTIPTILPPLAYRKRWKQPRSIRLRAAS